MDNRPSVVPNSKSATVRFIIRYVLRLRNWWLVAKVASVKAFTKTMKTTSVTKLANYIHSSVSEKMNTS